MEDQLLGFLGSQGIAIDKTEISACHILKTKDPTNKPPIIIRLVSRKLKINILKNGVKKQSTLRNRRESELGEKGWPWNYRNLSISEKYFLRGQTPSARQKHHQTRLLQQFCLKGKSVTRRKITNNIDNIIVGPSTGCAGYWNTGGA